MPHGIRARLKRNQGYTMPMWQVVLVLLALWAAFALPGLSRWRRAAEEGGASAGAWVAICACVFGPPVVFLCFGILFSALSFRVCRKERRCLLRDGVPDTLRNKADIDAVLQRIEDAMARQDAEALFEDMGIVSRCRIYHWNRGLWDRDLPWWDRNTVFWNKVYGCQWDASWWDWATMWWRSDTTYLTTYDRWKGLKPEAVRMLFRLVPPARFLDLPIGYSLEALDIRRALEPISEEMTSEQSAGIRDRFPLPGERSTPEASGASPRPSCAR